MNRLVLSEVFSYLLQDIKVAIKSEKGDFFVKVIKLNTLAEKYLDFLADNYDLSDEEFLSILTMAKACIFLNIKVFKFTEKSKMVSFRQQNPEFESLNSPDTKQEPWKGIKRVLYGSKWNDDREKYREIIRPLAKAQLKMFNNGDLSHLERFLPVSVNMTLRESTQRYVKENSAIIECWAKMPLNKFNQWIEELDDRMLRKIDEELASIKGSHKGRDDVKDVSWCIVAQKKKLGVVRQKRFGF